MITVRFFFADRIETHHLAGEWSREDLRERAKNIGAFAWE